MDTQTFSRLQAMVPDFVQKYCAMVKLSDISYDKEKSQVRVKGHVLSNVKGFANTMERDPSALPPVSVRGHTGSAPEPGRPLWSLVDGNTRALAAESAGLEEIFVSWYHDEEESPSPSEWRELQMKFNDHPRHSSSSAEDIVAFLEEESLHGLMQDKVGFAYKKNELLFIDKAAEYYHNVLHNTGWSLQQWKTKVKVALRGEIGASYETYLPSTVLTWLKDTTGIKSPGKTNGRVHEGKALWAFNKRAHLNPNIAGSILMSRRNNPDDNVKYILAFTVGDLAGKNSEAIHKERETVRQWVISFNEYTKTLDGEEWIAGLYFAPQIKSGRDKEILHKLIKAEI